MKKIILIGTALLLTVALGPSLLHAQQQTGPQQGWYCPWMNQGGGGAHRGGGCCGWWADAPFNHGQPVSQDQAKQMLSNYIRSRNDPNLVIGDIADKGNFFEAAITTRDGSLVETIQVDKNTGWFRNVS